MYRYEVDADRKIIVLVIHGTQDGWEAKLVKIEWANRLPSLSQDWSLIVDLEGYLREQGDAIREQKKFSPDLAAANLKNKLVILPKSEIDPSPIIGAANLTTVDSFSEAWKMCGGEDRTTRLAPPKDGGHYRANNPPAQLG